MPDLKEYPKTAKMLEEIAKKELFCPMCFGRKEGIFTPTNIPMFEKCAGGKIHFCLACGYKWVD